MSVDFNHDARRGIHNTLYRTVVLDVSDDKEIQIITAITQLLGDLQNQTERVRVLNYLLAREQGNG